MRVFLTGGTGYLGGRIAALLVQVGHDVIGLARSDGSSEALATIGVSPERGSLADTTLLTRVVGAVDAVIHTAFDHDLSRFDEAVAIEGAAVNAMLDGLSPGSRFILSLGTGVLSDTGSAIVDDADAAAMTQGDATGRAAIEHTVIEHGRSHAMRCAVVRLPLFVYGHGGSVFVPLLIKAARDVGFSAFVEVGANLFTAVHVDDAAALYLNVLGRNDTGGALFHAAAESGVSAKAIAEAVGTATGVCARSVPRDEAASVWGAWLAAMMTINNQTASSRARSLCWLPRRNFGLLSDIANGSYRR